MDSPATYLPPEEAPEWGVLAGWAARTGIPGALGEEKLAWPHQDRLFVARDEAGRPASVLMVRIDSQTQKPYLVIAVTRPDRRRQGLASALFAAAEAAGLPVEELSGVRGITADGAAFRAARRQAANPASAERPGILSRLTGTRTTRGSRG